MRKETEVVQGIEDIINWYFSIPNDYQDINELMNKRRKLCLYNYYLSTYVGDASMNYDSLYAERKKNYSSKVLAYRSQKKVTTEAENQAEIDVFDDRLSESSAKAVLYRYKSMSSKLEKIEDVMKQQISILRKEKEKENA